MALSHPRNNTYICDVCTSLDLEHTGRIQLAGVASLTPACSFCGWLLERFYDFLQEYPSSITSRIEPIFIEVAPRHKILNTHAFEQDVRDNVTYTFELFIEADKLPQILGEEIVDSSLGEKHKGKAESVSGRSLHQDPAGQDCLP